MTFEGIAPVDTSIGYDVSGSVTVSGVTFTSGPSVFLSLVNFSDPIFFNTGSISGGAVLSTLPFLHLPAILDITLPGTFTAIGFDTNTSLNAVVTVTLSDGTGLTYTVLEDPVLRPVGRFFGFTTATGITSLRLSGVIDDGPRSPLMNIDDFRFGQVPEPSSFILISVGLIGLAVKAPKRLS